MKNKGIVIFLIGIAVVIVGILVAEFLSSRPEHQASNPYALNMDTLYSVDKDLITYREIRDLKLDFDNPSGISGVGKKLTVVGDRKLITIDFNGKLLMGKPLTVDPLSVKTTRDRIYVGADKKVVVLDTTGTYISEFYLNDSSVITSIDVLDDKIFIADAGKRLVYRFGTDGKKEFEFEGKASGGDQHGFIVPSPSFDLAFNNQGELWIANPGKHALENYTINGELRGWWEASSADIKGFSGCCNPAHITFLPDGNLVTSEKRIVRIKEYKPSGELAGVVASPSVFEGEVHAPDLFCDDSGRIYALDSERKMIRIFEKIKK